MSALKMWMTSSVGKKLITGITGLGLVLFLVGHLTGNLLLFAGREAFNSYAYALHHLFHGAFIILAEIGLITFLVLHVVIGIQIALKRKKARATPYAVEGFAGGASRKSLSSKWMIFSGLLLLLFLVVHLIGFKFGPGKEAGYLYTLANGTEVRDVYTVVVEKFKNPVVMIFYVVCMVILGAHLKHGVWSALQSIGISHPDLTKVLWRGAQGLGVLLAVGFLLLPLFVFLFFTDPSAAELARSATETVAP